MQSPQDIALQQKLLDTYRRLLMAYLEQEKQWETTEVPAVVTTGISMLRGHIRDTKGVLRGWNVPVTDQLYDQGAVNEIASDVAHQRRLLQTYRANLARFQQQQIQMGVLAPPYLMHQIREAEEKIQQIVGILQGYGVSDV